MAVKKFSIKGLAEYMLAMPSRQRTILRQYKYPDEDEPRARRLYYREARDRISVHHSLAHHPSWLISQAIELEQLAQASTSRAKTRLRHNARALRQYSDHFGLEAYKILDDRVLYLAYGDVAVSVVPELHVEQKKRELLVKLDFSKNEPDPRLVKVVSQAMFEAANQAGMNLNASDIRYIDVARGKVHKGAKLGARMGKDIEAACANISAIWTSI